MLTVIPVSDEGRRVHQTTRHGRLVLKSVEQRSVAICPAVEDKSPAARPSGSELQSARGSGKRANRDGPAHIRSHASAALGTSQAAARRGETHCASGVVASPTFTLVVPSSSLTSHVKVLPSNQTVSPTELELLYSQVAPLVRFMTQSPFVTLCVWKLCCDVVYRASVASALGNAAPRRTAPSISSGVNWVTFRSAAEATNAPDSQ